MRTKLTLLLLCFCSSVFSESYLCKSETEENFYLVKHDGLYIKTDKLKEEYDPEDSSNTPCFVFIDDDETLLLLTPTWRSSYRITVLDKTDRIWVSNSISPHVELKEELKDYLKENDFKSHGTFTIIDESISEQKKTGDG